MFTTTCCSSTSNFQFVGSFVFIFVSDCLENDEDTNFLYLFSIFISFLSPYIYYSAVFSHSRDSIVAYELEMTYMTSSAMDNVEVSSFVNAYRKQYVKRHYPQASMDAIQIHDILVTPITRVRNENESHTLLFFLLLSLVLVIAHLLRSNHGETSGGDGFASPAVAHRPVSFSIKWIGDFCECRYCYGGLS